MCYIYSCQIDCYMKSNKLLLILICSLFFHILFAQDNYQQKLDSFSGKFITAIRSQEQQRVSIVTDKSIYVNGESVWFKAFLLNSISQKINNKSKFLFVDLVDEKDSVIKIVILDAYNKQLDSRIILPDKIPTGNYWLRAYTREMVEKDTSNICVKPLYIINRLNENITVKPVRKVVVKDTVPIMNFYPEGGSMITGINSKVGLRVSHSNGVPIEVEGFIKDDHNVIIAHFITNESGFGKFDFEPSGYRKYHAAINWHGSELDYPLPAFGFWKGQVAVMKQSGGYKLRILLGDSVYRKDFMTYLVGIVKDSLIFASIGRGQYETNITQRQLPDGVATFYLFDEKFNLLSERSIYVHDNSVVVKVGTDKNIYSKRDKVIMHISITDVNQKSVPSLIAISVIDTTVGGVMNYNSLMPAGELQNSLENKIPWEDENMDDDNVDLSMLARNSSYQTLSKAKNSFSSMVADSLLYIKGVALNSKNEPASKKVINLLFNTGDISLHTDTTNAMGRFSFPVENYSDSAHFALEVRDLSGRPQNVRIILDEHIYPKLHTPGYLKEYLAMPAKGVRKYLNTYYESGLNDDRRALPRVIVSGPARPLNYDQSKRVSTSSTILTSYELNERNSVEAAILNVSGMHIINGVLVINGLTAMKAPDKTSEPMLLINGTEVALSSGIGESSPVMSYLNDLNPKNIDFIEILKGAEGANYGLRGGNGVILVNLLNSSRDVIQTSGNIKNFYAKGISNPAFFQNTTYEQHDKSLFPDNRSTLFWNGNFFMDNNSSVILYTSDIPSTYKAVITGVTIHGELIHKTIKFQSK